jgi:hypothetical protein
VYPTIYYVAIRGIKFVGVENVLFNSLTDYSEVGTLYRIELDNIYHADFNSENSDL